MTRHVATVVPLRPAPAPALFKSRNELIHEMALHLIAGVTVGLDLSSDFDVIRYLKDAPERYRASIITCCMDAAIAEARQTIIASVFGER